MRHILYTWQTVGSQTSRQAYEVASEEEGQTLAARLQGRANVQGQPPLYAAILPLVEKPSKLRKVAALSKWPTKWAVALSLVCGALTVVNQTTLGFPTAAKTAITWGLAAFAFMGVGPILGPKFAATLKLPAKMLGAISLLLLVGMTVAQQQLPLPYSAIVIGVVNVLGGLGFEPAVVPTIL